MIVHFLGPHTVDKLLYHLLSALRKVSRPISCFSSHEVEGRELV